MLRRLFDASYRKARSLEAQGDYRSAAALYAEAGANDEAVAALIHSGKTARSARERADAYSAALRFMKEGDARRGLAESEIARAVIAEVPGQSALQGDEKVRVQEAARILERHGHHTDALRGYELVGDEEGMARCLTKSGEVDKLESLLSRDLEREGRERALSRAMKAYEEAMALGARIDALDALARARASSDTPARIDEMIVRLRERFAPAHRVELRVGEARFVFVGKDTVVLGRDADLSIRGVSVSREHCSVSLGENGRIVVKDLGSRNGTLIARVPIRASLELDNGAVVGLGDDVDVRLDLNDAGIRVEVLRGPDTGLVALVSNAPMRVPGVNASLVFFDSHALLQADAASAMRVNGVATTMPVALLRGDLIEVDDVRVEVGA